MAIAIVEYEIDGDNAVAASLSANFASQPSSGNSWLVMGGVYFADSTDDISITAPASTTQRITPGIGGNINMVAAEKTSSGSDGVASTVTKSGTNRSLGLFSANLSGSAYDTTAGSAKDGPTSSVTTRTTTSAGNVSTDNSLAIHTTFLRRVGTYTYSFNNGATELASIVAATSNQLSVHVATKTVSSGATATTGFQMDTGTATNLVAGQVVYNPSNAAPTITVPGAQRYVIGVAEVVSGISITDADNDESVLTLTCTKGTWAAPTPTNVDVSGSGTSTMTLTGTTTELNTYLAAGNGPTYTHSTANHDADTLTINIDDQVNAPDEDTIAVTALDWRITAASLALVNATFQDLLVTGTVVGDTVLSLYAEDSGGLSGTDTTTITFNATQAGGASGRAVSVGVGVWV